MAFSDKLLAEADALCARCLMEPSDTMLCSGIRLYRRVEYDNAPATPGACSKLREKREEEFVGGKLKSSGIPKSVLDTGTQDPLARFDGTFLFREASEEFTNYVFDWGMNAMRDGKAFKYVLTHLLIKNYSDWDNLIIDLGTRFDIVVLDRFNVGRVEDYVSKSFAELLQFRYSNNLQTVVTYEAWKPRNPTEERLYVKMDEWSEE